MWALGRRLKWVEVFAMQELRPEFQSPEPMSKSQPHSANANSLSAPAMRRERRQKQQELHKLTAQLTWQETLFKTKYRARTSAPGAL